MQNPPLDLVRRLLAELAQTAEHASLTRSLGGGEPAAARAFNGALRTLTVQGLVPEGLFEPVGPDGADYGSLGVQARLLLACVGDEPTAKNRHGGKSGPEMEAVVALAPFLASGDLTQMLRERIDETAEVPDGLLTALAPFLDSGDLGELVRRRMRPKSPPATPAPWLPQKDLRPVAVPDAPVSLESLAAELRRPDLTVEERQRIAMRVADLSYEQSVQAAE